MFDSGDVSVMGPITGNGRAFFMERINPDRLIDREDFANGRLPTVILNELSRLFEVPFEFHNDEELE